MAVKQALAEALDHPGVPAAGLALGGAVAIAVVLLFAFPAHRDRGPGSAATAGESTTTGSVLPPGTSGSEGGKPGSLEDAKQAFREGRFEDAIATYQGLEAGAADRETVTAAMLGEAVARFENGDRTGSVARLKAAVGDAPLASQAGREARYLLGVRLNEDGLSREASEVLGPLLDGNQDPLTPYIEAEHARAAAALGDASAAAREWDAAIKHGAGDPVLLAAVYEQRAATAKAGGDLASEAQWLGKAVDVQGDVSARYRLAGVARELGDKSTFADQMWAIVSGFAGSDESVLAIADLRAAGYPVDTGQEGYVYYRRGAYTEARRVLGAAVKEDGLSAAEKVFRYYYLAAANEDAGNAAVTVEYYDTAARIAADSPYVHRAKYWAARVVEGRGDATAASARYVSLVLDGPQGEFAAEAKFRAGFTLFEAGDARGALATWDRLGAAGDSRLEYWRGRAREQVGDAEGARAALEVAFAEGPLDFYGAEAGRRLGREPALDVSYRPLETPGEPDWAALGAWVQTVGGGRPWTEPPTAVGELLAVGLRAQGEAVLKGAANDASRAQLLGLARQAYVEGLPNVAAAFANEILDSTGVSWRDAPQGLQRLAFPIDYVALLDAEGKRNGIDPLFLAALIRQESLWDAGAESRAGALGLTQVIPSTGDGIARALGVPFRSVDLFRPAVSIRFGAYYLEGEVQRFGSAAAALAAYNAGPGSVVKWLGAARGDSLADFVEAVDIEETRQYVELVVEHYAHYRVAYGR